MHPDGSNFCPYCKVRYDEEAAGRYIDALIREIHLVGGQSEGKKTATSLYFGGGTPALLADRLHEIIDAIRNIDVDMTQNWNHRYRENMLRLKSGDLTEVARVVKSLMLRESSRSLSTGERKMLHSAKQILISELVLSKNCSYEDMEACINQALM